MKKTHIGLLLAGVFCLNSCYFNSAGFIFDAASHNALVRGSDASAGQIMYSDGVHYYIWLPRYRYDDKVILQYSSGYPILQEKGRKNAEPKKPETTNSSQLVQIPYSAAAYMMGEDLVPTGYLRPVSDDVLTSCHKRYAIKRTLTPSFCLEYRYKSDSAGWLYGLGVLDWLCVDLPITCVENALAFTGTLFFFLGESGDRMKESPLLQDKKNSNGDWRDAGTIYAERAARQPIEQGQPWR